MSLQSFTATSERARHLYDATSDELDRDLEFGDEFLEQQEEYTEAGDEYYSDDDEEASFVSAGKPMASGAPLERAAVTAEAVADQQPTESMISLQRETNLLLTTLFHQISDQQSSAHAAAVRAQNLNSGVMTKEINFVLNASLKDLAENPSRCKLVLSGDDSNVFPSKPVPLVGATIKNFRSSFPVSLLLTAPHLGNLADNAVVTQSKFQGLFVIPGKSSSPGNINEHILTDTESNFAREFRQTFANTTLDNVEDGIIYNTKKHDGKTVRQALIPPESCVASQIVDRRIKEGIDHQSIFDHNLGKLVVDEIETKLAINEIKSKLQKQVRARNLNSDLYFMIKRAVISDKARADKSAQSKFDNWLDTAEIGGLIKSGNVSNEMTKTHHLYLTVNVKYINTPDN